MRRFRRYRRLLRRPIPFWFATLAVTALTVSSIERAAGSAADARDRWGRLVPALVAVDDLEPGDPLEDVEVQLLPAGLVPADAVSEVGRQVVAAWIGRGEVVRAARLTPAGLSATAARLPRGARGVAVPHGIAPLPVEVGDRVDVLATDELATTVTIATGAPVVAVGDEAVTVAVDQRDAAAVAGAVAMSTVTLVLSGPSSPRSR